MNLAYQCFRLALASNNDHAEAYNNLGVLEMRKGHIEQVGGQKRNFGIAMQCIMKIIRDVQFWGQILDVTG